MFAALAKDDEARSYLRSDGTAWFSAVRPGVADCLGVPLVRRGVTEGVETTEAACSLYIDCCELKLEAAGSGGARVERSVPENLQRYGPGCGECIRME